MKLGLKGWGLVGLSVLASAQACAGKGIREVGDVGTAGNAEADPGSAGSTSTGGKSGLVKDPPLQYAGEAGSPPTPEPVAGTGGTGGTHAIDPVIEGGEGGAGATAQPLCAGCTIVAEEQGVVNDVEANEQKVFWIDHGSYDRFKNHRGDGRLVARALDGGELEVLSDTLPGPTNIELTDTYAYMLVDALSGAQRIGVVRVPLAGGAAVKVAGLPPEGAYFTTSADHAYYSTVSLVDNVYISQVYGIADTPDAVPQLLYTGPFGLELLADKTTVYLFNGHEVHAMPVAGGTPTLFATPNGEVDPQDIDGDYIYTIESDRVDAFVVRTAKSDASGKRVAKNKGYDFDMRGDMFFAHAPFSYGYPDRIVQGDLVTGDVSALVIAAADTLKHFAASEVGVFFSSDDGTITLVPYLK